MRKSVINTSLVALGLALLMPACRHDKSDSSGGNAPAHAKQGQKLRDTMHQLAEQTAYSPVSKLPPDPESDKKSDPKVFEEAEKLASQLAKTAATIPTSKRDRPLSEAARADFEKLAMDLQRQAKDLEAAAKAHQVEQMQRSFRAINATCVGCHSRFRDFAGELDFGRAAAPRNETDASTASAR